MPLPPEFLTQLPTKTDEELYEMLGQADDYLPEAIEAAREELRKRALPAERAANLEAAVQSQKVAVDARSQERLGWPMRILIFLLCAGIAGAILAVYYGSKGYKRKESDCWITMGLSLLAHFVAAVFLLSMR